MDYQAHTFLFADLVGFTRFTAQHGDERAADLAVSFHEHVRSLADELGCHVVKAVGDGVMVRSESGAVAVSLARRILSLTEREGLPPLRIGLDTGPAVERNGDWFGSTVNTASRVVSLAGAGELLMTERTRDASTGMPAFESSVRGRHRLKGLPEHALFGDARCSHGAAGARHAARPISSYSAALGRGRPAARSSPAETSSSDSSDACASSAGNVGTRKSISR
jgi:class 3 adenylate cyclase